MITNAMIMAIFLIIVKRQHKVQDKREEKGAITPTHFKKRR
jgi:hypothetical protein